MDVISVIRTKHDHSQLSDEQIDWAVDAYTQGTPADEQISALAKPRPQSNPSTPVSPRGPWLRTANRHADSHAAFTSKHSKTHATTTAATRAPRDSKIAEQGTEANSGIR
jgi:hypothetical protein